jgi:hypothetical protein
VKHEDTFTGPVELIYGERNDDTGNIIIRNRWVLKELLERR